MLQPKLNTFLRGLITLRPELKLSWSKRNIQLRIRVAVNWTCRKLYQTLLFVKLVVTLNINVLRKKDKGVVFLR